MNRITFSIVVLLFLFIFSQTTLIGTPKMDKFTFGEDNLNIHFIGHGTLMLDFNGTIIHIDPVKQFGDYDSKPKADIILITHAHGDHLDIDAISKITKNDTKLILNQDAFSKVNKGIVLTNGKSFKIKNINIKAVPAYNTTEGRDKYHPKGRDNGYVLTLGNKQIYIAGDTEDIPEMKNLKNIEIAFLPMNQPFTMTPEQVVNAVKIIKPKILYPYHFGDTDLSKLQKLMENIKNVELRLRDLK